MLCGVGPAAGRRGKRNQLSRRRGDFWQGRHKINAEVATLSFFLLMKHLRVIANHFYRNSLIVCGEVFEIVQEKGVCYNLAMGKIT